MNASQNYQWFFALDLDEQVALLADPDMPLPATIGIRLAQLNTPIVSTGWALQSANGFTLTHDHARGLRRRRDELLAWWDELPDDARAAFIEHRNDEIPAEFAEFSKSLHIVVAATGRTAGSDARSIVVAPMTKAFLEWQARSASKTS